MKSAVLLALLLVGCQSPQDQFRAQMAFDDAKCADYGLVRGTQAYADCRQELEAQRNGNRRAMATAILGMRAPQAEYHPIGR